MAHCWHSISSCRMNDWTPTLIWQVNSVQNPDYLTEVHYLNKPFEITEIVFIDWYYYCLEDFFCNHISYFPNPCGHLPLTREHTSVWKSRLLVFYLLLISLYTMLKSIWFNYMQSICFSCNAQNKVDWLFPVGYFLQIHQNVD